MVKFSSVALPIRTVRKTATQVRTIVKAHKVASLIITSAVVASVATIGAAALTINTTPIAAPPVTRPKAAAPKEEQHEAVKAASTTESVTNNKASSPTAPASSPATSVVSTTPKPSAPAARQPAKTIPTPTSTDPNPNAIKLVIPAQAARRTSPLEAELVRTQPMRFNFDYQIARDGSYGSSVYGSASYYSGPGTIGDIYCGSTKSISGDNGIAEIVINYKAPAGTYTCGIATDIGNTRYETRYQFELTNDSLTILPGYQVIPGRRF